MQKKTSIEVDDMTTRSVNLSKVITFRMRAYFHMDELLKLIYIYKYICV